MRSVHRNLTPAGNEEQLALMSKSQHQSPHSDSRSLLDRIAAGILAEVDAADIFDIEQPAQKYPTFVTNEIVTGRVLGKGSTGVVKEIMFIVDPLLQGGGEPEQERPDDDEEEPEITEAQRHMRNVQQCFDQYLIEGCHYDISSAKHTMHRRCLRDGETRYAVKSLNLDKLKGEDLFRAQIDLALEIKFLHVLSHPNIVRLRGLKKTDDHIETTNFFIMDRLVQTLAERLDHHYKKEHKKQARRRFFTRNSAKTALQELWIERLVNVFDLHSALKYMHSCKLIHRDLKPTNIGFDVRNDLKVFDFGLAKALSSKASDANGLYKLTGLTGAFPYMAPEVAREESYNEKSDVFSFGILMWEILALQRPFSSLKTRKQCYYKIAIGGARPKIPTRWPATISVLCKACWNSDLYERPSMDMVGEQLCSEIISSRDLFAVNMTNRSHNLRRKSDTSQELACFDLNTMKPLLVSTTTVDANTVQERMIERSHSDSLLPCLESSDQINSKLSQRESSVSLSSLLNELELKDSNVSEISNSISGEVDELSNSKGGRRTTRNTRSQQFGMWAALKIDH